MDVAGNAEDSGSMQLGGNIELIGFSDIDKAQLVVVKKMVGNYAKKFSEMVKNFEKLSIAMKEIHNVEKPGSYEINAKIMAEGRPINSSVTDRNLFFGIDKALKVVEEMIKK
ncbi:MAG: hypothetical protein NTV63_00350 [Candidatus Woesearchaeota archaeon]|nr:hypothetical protein [Candidatus Woesearchaeota archaeon]